MTTMIATYGKNKDCLARHGVRNTRSAMISNFAFDCRALTILCLYEVQHLSLPILAAPHFHAVVGIALMTAGNTVP